jgi:sporulation protein YlmC with PRC-barrel domain
MGSKHLLIVLASAGLAVCGPALAQRGGGLGGGVGGGTGGGVRGGGDGPRGGGTDARGESRVNSQGPLNADERAMYRANENSVLRGTSNDFGNLAGLRIGLSVVNRNGTTIGTVSRVVTDHQGRVRTVLVTGADGQRRRIRLAPRTVSVSGDVVTTNSTWVDTDD